MADMDENLLKLTVEFLEICQTGVLSGKMNYMNYNSCIGIKLEFLGNFLKSDASQLSTTDASLIKRIHRVFSNHYFLSNLYKEVSGG